VQLRSSLQLLELFCPGKILDPGTIRPWLYGRRSKKRIQQPRHVFGRKLLTFSPGLKHAVVGDGEPPGAAGRRDRRIRPEFGTLSLLDSGQNETRPYHIQKLVSCPINNMAFAVGQLAVFQGGASRTGTSDEHI
jgi:hypothetical protein